MSLPSSMSELDTPMATPRAVPVGLPSMVEGHAVPMNKQEARKKAREERHLQFLEEERLEDEQAVVSIMNRSVDLGLPFETVKAEFEDLDGLSHPTSSRLMQPYYPACNDVSGDPTASRSGHPTSLPPLTMDATIRAALPVGRRSHLPSSFKVPGSPQLDTPLSRKSSRRSMTRRRASERACRATSVN